MTGFHNWNQGFDERSMTLEIGDAQFWQNSVGLSCANYVSRGWCSNGGFTAGFEWTGKEQYLDRSTVPQECQDSISFQQSGNCAEFYNYPGRNCVACGKGVTAANCSIIDGSTSSSTLPMPVWKFPHAQVAKFACPVRALARMVSPGQPSSRELSRWSWRTVRTSPLSQTRPTPLPRVWESTFDFRLHGSAFN